MNIESNASIDEEIKSLVLARLESLPAGISISIGSKGDFTKDDLLKHVEAEDEIGKKFIAMDMEFLYALKKGELFG